MLPDPVMIRSVLVPLDASPFGEHAIPVAASLARRAEATLHLAHVHVPVPPPAELEGTPYYDTMFYGAVMDREREYMDGIRERVAGIEGVEVETSLLSGSIVEALQEHGEAVAASIVVLSTHGYEGLMRLLQHGLVDRLLRRLSGPVLAIRPEDDAPPPDLARDVVFRHLLVPLDGTPAGEGILRHAIALARLFGAQMTLLRPADAAGSGGPGVFGQDAPADTRGAARAREQAERYLENVAAEVRDAGVEVSTRVELTDAPAETILEVAGEGGAGTVFDLIAMDTRARKGIARLLRGSVAGDVLQESPVPMLLHHTPRDGE